MDIIELDAASNRGVEEIREIRDKVHFQPAQSKRKIYIIDEAHMLTREASNAFLKTLEEPPAHVIFILCTTEADRLLPTILSRCQRYDFRRLPGQTIYDRLAHITDQEAVAIHPDALRLVAPQRRRLYARRPQHLGADGRRHRPRHHPQRTSKNPSASPAATPT